MPEGDRGRIPTLQCEVRQQFGAPEQMSPGVSSAQVHTTWALSAHWQVSPVQRAAQMLFWLSQKSNSQAAPAPPDELPHAVSAVGGLKHPLLPPVPVGLVVAPPVPSPPETVPPPEALPPEALPPSTTTLPPQAARKPGVRSAAQKTSLFIIRSSIAPRPLASLQIAPLPAASLRGIRDRIAPFWQGTGAMLRGGAPR